MTGLFDNVLEGSYATGANSGSELSYEEESFIDKEITSDPSSLSNYTNECYIEMTSVMGALAVSEGFAAQELLQGKSRESVMESLADRAADAYDTLKRWATKIWKAIKKFVQKAWNRLKVIKDRIVAFFTNYEEVLKNYSNGTKNIDWVDMKIKECAAVINSDYNLEVDVQGRYDSSAASHSGNMGSVIQHTVDKWRKILYISDTKPVYTKKSWNDVKGTVMQVTSMGYDKFSKDFLNWGEKDFREAMSLDKERIEDRQDDYDDIDKDKEKKKYFAKRDTAREKIVLARTRLQLRQRGIQLLNEACTRQFNQCVAAAKIAIRGKNGVSESYTPDMSSILSMMI